MKKSKYNVHEDEVQPARVQLKDGWREMNIRFLLDKKTVGITSAVLWKAVIKAGAVHQKHVHRVADEVCYVIKGKGRHGQGDEEWDIGPGDSYFAPRGLAHWAYGTDPKDPLTVIGTYVGGGSLEDTGYEFVEALDPKV